MATDALSPLERTLLEHVERGELLDLAGAEPTDEKAMRAWPPSRTVRAEILREVLRGRLVAEPDPHGVRLRGARIAGRVDLENLTSSAWLELTDCFLDEGLNARDATLPGLVLDGCLVEHPAEPAIDAERVTATTLVLDRATIRANGERGAVCLAGAHLGRLDCTNADVRGESGPALDADGLRVDQSLVLDGLKAVGAGANGTIQLTNAVIGGLLTCTGGTVRNKSGCAMVADGVRVDAGIYFRDGFEAVATAPDGAIRLVGAHVGGQLDCTRAKVRNKSGTALDAANLRVDQGCYFDDADLAGTGDDGAVDLTGAHVGGPFECTGSRVRNESGPALNGTGLEVDQGVVLRDSEVVGAGESGAITFVGAHLRSKLECTSVRATNESGPALHAEFLRVGQTLYLGDCTAAGAVNLLGAHIGGQLNCWDSSLRNESGPALNADSLRVEQSVFFRGRFEAVGAGESGAVNLTGAHVGSQLDCSGLSARNESGPALNADSLRVEQSLLLRDRFEAVGGGEAVAVNLIDVRIGSAFDFEPARLAHLTSRRYRLDATGLVYSGLPIGVGAAAWLKLLREATPAYAAQPYQQLAGAQRAAGHDNEARRTLVEQRRAQVDRGALTTGGERAWARLTGLTLGYGYQPWRALLGLVGALTVAVVLACWLGGQGGLAHVSPGAAASPCTLVERVGVGLDLGSPLISTGARAQCDYTRTTTGAVLTVAGWALRLLVWAFATLFIVGFTGAVRKT